MSGLKPLIEASTSSRGRELLRAARLDRPSPKAAGRALAALGVATTAKAAGAVVAAASAQAGAGVGAGVAASLPIIGVKWLAVGVLGGLVLASGAAVVSSKLVPPAARSSQVAVAAPPTRAAAARTPEPAAPAVIDDLPNVVSEPTDDALPSGVHRAPAVASNSGVAQKASLPLTAPSQGTFEPAEQSKLLHDVALLDDARRAVRSSDAALAAQLLDRYDAERQTHLLDHEARLLRQRLGALPAGGR